MKKGIRWGILGPGKIAITFAEAVNLIGEDVIVAVASHDERKAAAFAAEHQIAHGYGSYEELVSRDDIDAVYVSNLHMMHRDAALMAMRHGKAVLCEKPMAINAASARAMAKAAGENHVFLMEAMWSRFLPATVKALELAGAGSVGDIRVIRGAFSYGSSFDPHSRIYDPALAGGGLLDVGVYAISCAASFFGFDPIQILGAADIGNSGVDEQAAMILTYEDGQMAVLNSGVNVSMPGWMEIYGRDGYLEIPSFWDAQVVRLHRNGKDEVETFSFPHRNGFVYEVEHASRCIREGLMESPIWPLSSTIAVAEIMDTLRRSWGLRYPGEE